MTLKAGPTCNLCNNSMLPNEPKLKIKDLKPMRVIGVTKTIKELLTIVQLGDAMEGEESCTVHEVSKEPFEAGRKWLPIIEILLPMYISVPGKAEVGNTELTSGGLDTVNGAVNVTLLGLPKCKDTT